MPLVGWMRRDVHERNMSCLTRTTEKEPRRITSKQTGREKIHPKIACSLCEWERGCIRILSARSSSFLLLPSLPRTPWKKSPSHIDSQDIWPHSLIIYSTACQAHVPEQDFPPTMRGSSRARDVCPTPRHMMLFTEKGKKVAGVSKHFLAHELHRHALSFNASWALKQTGFQARLDVIRISRLLSYACEIFFFLKENLVRVAGTKGEITGSNPYRITP